jgi:hypothetical protein
MNTANELCEKVRKHTYHTPTNTNYIQALETASGFLFSSEGGDDPGIVAFKFKQSRVIFIAWLGDPNASLVHQCPTLDDLEEDWKSIATYRFVHFGRH